MEFNADESCFNLRVYGICFTDQEHVILSAESYKGIHFTKFLGGGLEYGEGMKEALKREWMEEAQIEIEVGEHFYTTDFFQKSIYDSRQIISIYYIVEMKNPPSFPLKTDTGIYDVYSLNQLLENLDLPIDQVVGKLILDQIKEDKDFFFSK